MTEIQSLFVIRTEEEFMNVFYKEACGDDKSPIDFDQYTLLGAYTAEGGCLVEFEREVLSLASEEKVLYSILVKHCGYCEKLVGSENLVLVPKIPEDWTVELKVQKVELED